MNKKKKKQEKAPAIQSAFEFLCEEEPDYQYQKIDDEYRRLEVFLDLCREVYWVRVMEGTFPWPPEIDDINSIIDNIDIDD